MLLVSIESVYGVKIAKCGGAWVSVQYPQTSNCQLLIAPIIACRHNQLHHGQMARKTREPNALFALNQHGWPPVAPRCSPSGLDIDAGQHVVS